MFDVSIPNGMEFYTSFTKPILAVGLSFNSQRDGILLLSIILKILQYLMFQFPTGWNSTYFGKNLEMGNDVSIPNGMEFYLISSGFSFSQLCFNSQRDGILRSPPKFNVRSFKGFQFPTGWNSTKRTRAYCSYSLVSIPNGMEFYAIRPFYLSADTRFNSQRDGILRSMPSFLAICCRSFNSQRDGILRLF